MREAKGLETGVRKKDVYERCLHSYIGVKGVESTFNSKQLEYVH
jgi:hypothetical protein